MIKKIYQIFRLFPIPKIYRQSFEKEYNVQNIKYIRISYIIFSLLSFFYLYLDYISSPSAYRYFWFMRIPIGIILPWILFFLTYNKTILVKYIQIFNAIYVFLYSFIILVMIFLFSPKELAKQDYIIGLIMIFIGALGLRLRFKYILFSFTLIILLAFILFFIQWSIFYNYGFYLFLNKIYFLLTAYLAVIVVSILLENYAIMNFLYQKDLQHKNQQLVESYQEIQIQKRILEKQSIELKKRYKIINESLSYAVKIQRKVIPFEKIEKKDNMFVFFKSKEAVGGDFFYYKCLNDIEILALGDCTGHGIPGAMLSMMSISLLQDFINQDIKSPAEILEKLRIDIKRILGSDSYEGLELALIFIDKTAKELIFAGAGRDIILVRNNVLYEIKGNQSPIGNYLIEKKFENMRKKLYNGDIIYLFSDGFYHQIGKNNRLFSIKRLKNLILKIHSLPMKQQKQEFYRVFTQWKGNKLQVDDITVMGYKFFSN